VNLCAFTYKQINYVESVIVVDVVGSCCPVGECVIII